MSKQRRTKEEYLKMYARDYCVDKEEVAREHKIVKEVCKETDE